MPSPISSVPSRTTSTPRRNTQFPESNGISWSVSDLFGHTPTLGLSSSGIIEGRRISPRQLRNFSRTIPAQRAIGIIANGVMGMPWTIEPPSEESEDAAAHEEAARLEQAMLYPNLDDQPTYPEMVWSMVTDLITLGYATVERQEGDEEHPFWWWAADAAIISYNPHWFPGSSEPRWIESDTSFGVRTNIKYIDNENLFLLKYRANSYEFIPPSPLEIAYEIIEGWLGISKFQSSTTANAVREFLISLEDCQSQADLDRVREYWNSIVGTGEIPILGGKVTIQKMGARNDEELYPKFTDYILRIIALAFNLSSQDFGLIPHDNRATAEVAYTATFQNAVSPMALLINKAENLHLLNFYRPGYTKKYSDTQPTNEKEEADRASVLYAGNLCTRNEGRLMVGLPSIGEAGDKFIDGMNLSGEKDEAVTPEKTETGLTQLSQGERLNSTNALFY